MKTRTLEIAGKTDPGCVRKNNEDSLAVVPELGLMAVADGMGGHSSGEVASQIATETIRDFADKMIGGSKQLLPEGAADPARSARSKQLEFFVKTANTMIYEKARAFPKDHGMGTTIVAAIADERSMTVAHVGDSRLYLLRRGELQVMTEDHSLVMDQVRRGLITAEQAEKSAIQNILTRALGTEAEVVVDVQDHPLFPGDLVLLCSDGLTKMVPEAEIEKILEGAESCASACDALIERARAAGGVDNITVVVARVPEDPGAGIKKLFSRIFSR